MKKNQLIALVLAIVLTGITCTGAAKKTILTPINSTSPRVAIENLYITSHQDHPPLIAFYGEDEKHLFIYNLVEKEISRIELNLNDSLMESTAFSFVTFIWDQQRYGYFAAVFSKMGMKKIYSGQFEDRKLEKIGKVSEKTTSFNYSNGVVTFLDLETGCIESIGGDSPLDSLKPRATGITLINFKRIPGSDDAYFTLRNIETNNYGIYKGKKFEKIVDLPEFDELYPHSSTGGRLLGFMQRNRQTAATRICMADEKNNIITSNFTFALEENAILREYSRMHFLGETLYYFIKTPDQNSRYRKVGLFKLSKTRNEVVLSCKAPLIEKGEMLIDLLTGKTAKFDKIFKVPPIKSIIPVKYINILYYVFLTNNGSYEVEIEHPQKKNYYIYPKVSSQLIIISEGWPCK